jgi:hypothetical protein
MKDHLEAVIERVFLEWDLEGPSAAGAGQRVRRCCAGSGGGDL